MGAINLILPGARSGQAADQCVHILSVHKSKGLEADFVILLQCNKDTYGFPSLVSDDPVLNYVLTKSDRFPYGEERRLFYVAITRAKEKLYIVGDIDAFYQGLKEIEANRQTSLSLRFVKKTTRKKKKSVPKF
mgnify:CR=1 FL=1